MLNTAQYSKSNKLQDAAFVQLKNPDTGELEFTKKEVANSETGKVETVNDKPIGFELHSMQSKEFKRALHKTAHLGLTKKEKERYKAIEDNLNDGVSISENDLDFMDECEEKVASRMKRVFAMVTTKLHHIELPADFAKDHEIAVGKEKDGACPVTLSVENLHKLYTALPDLSTQISNGIATQENFTKS